MTYPELLQWIHLIAAGTWTGGLIVVGAVLPALREAGVTRDQLRAMARRFGAVSWGALLVAAVTGVLIVDEFGFPWSDQTLIAKLSLIVIALALAMVHQVTARRSSPAVRGLIQGIILGVSIAIFGVAVTL